MLGGNARFVDDAFSGGGDPGFTDFGDVVTLTTGAPTDAHEPLLQPEAVAVPIYGASALPTDFTGHYKDYDVPYFFNQLVMSFYNLRDICRTGKYNQAFADAQRDLDELLTIIATNDLDEGDAALGTSSIELRYGQISQRLDQSTNEIVRKKNTKDEKFLAAVGEVNIQRGKVIEKITYAFNARTPSAAYPQPMFSQNSLSPPQLKELIDELPNPPKSRSFIQKAIHVFPHAYHHSRELSITAMIFTIGALFTAGQSTIDHFFDNPDVAAEDRPSTVATFAFPIVLGLIGLGFGIAALATSHRKQLKRCFRGRSMKLPGDGSSLELGVAAGGTGNIQGGESTIAAAPQAVAAPPAAVPVASAPAAHLMDGTTTPPPAAALAPSALPPNTIAVLTAPLPASVAASPAGSMRSGSGMVGGFVPAPAIPHRVPFPGAEAGANELLRYLKGEVGAGDVPLDNTGNHETAVATLRAYIPQVSPHDALAGEIRTFFDANGILEALVQFGFG